MVKTVTSMGGEMFDRILKIRPVTSNEKIKLADKNLNNDEDQNYEQKKQCERDNRRKTDCCWREISVTGHR